MPFFVLGVLAEPSRCRGQLNRCSLVWGAGTLRRHWLKLWESWNFAPSQIAGVCQAHHHTLLNVCILHLFSFAQVSKGFARLIMSAGRDSHFSVIVIEPWPPIMLTFLFQPLWEEMHLGKGTAYIGPAVTNPYLDPFFWSMLIHNAGLLNSHVPSCKCTFLKVIENPSLSFLSQMQLSIG